MHSGVGTLLLTDLGLDRLGLARPDLAAHCLIRKGALDAKKICGHLAFDKRELDLLAAAGNEGARSSPQAYLNGHFFDFRVNTAQEKTASNRYVPPAKKKALAKHHFARAYTNGRYRTRTCDLTGVMYEQSPEFRVRTAIIHFLVQLMVSFCAADPFVGSCTSSNVPSFA